MSDNDELRMDEITPEMLGCLGEQEIDPGVLEETASVEKPKNLCFENIPFKKRKNFRKLYDGFDKKDISFEEFCIQLYALQSPGLMQQDLAKITNQKQMGQARKAVIDHTVNRMN